MAIAGVGSDLLFFFSSFSTWKFDGEKDYGVFIDIAGDLEAVQWDLLDIMEIWSATYICAKSFLLGCMTLWDTYGPFGCGNCVLL